jgi:type IV pilus assembly protein PilN
MIRINLLGVPKAKNKRSAVPTVTLDMGEPGSPRTKILIMVALVGVANWAYWHQLDKQTQVIANNMKLAEQKNHELADVKTRYMERQREADNYKRRVDVIDQLRSSQTGPVQLLDTIGNTINDTEAVWLDTMKDQGNSIEIEGMALSADGVASLIQNLQKTGYFRSIEIKETYQDESYKEMQAFQFTLTCAKAKS